MPFPSPSVSSRDRLTFGFVKDNPSKVVDAKLGIMNILRWDVNFTFTMEGIDFDKHGGICALEVNIGTKGWLSRLSPALACAQ